MKRWGIFGLLALAACAPESSTRASAQGQVCPGIIAGGMAGAMDVRQGLDDRQPSRMNNDGREPVIIRFRRQGGTQAAHVTASGASFTASTGATVSAVYRSIPAVAARVTPMERYVLERSELVESIEVDQIWSAQGLTPGLFAPLARQAAATLPIPSEYTEGLRLVEAPEVWDADGDGVLDVGAPTGEGVKVCVIDSGLDMGHPEFQGAVVASRDFLDEDDDANDRDGRGQWGQGHGTHVAGIIAARMGQGGSSGPRGTPGGMVGVAPGASLLIARVLDLQGQTQMSVVLSAMEWCDDQGARVVSMSLGGGTATRSTVEAFQALRDHGMLVVAAAGNQGGPVLYPASDPSVLAVGAVDAQERRANFSNAGPALALVAPGVDVLSTFPRGLGAFAEMSVENTSPLSRSLLYSPTGDTSGRLVDCGLGDSLDACLGATCDGFVAYVRPGAVPVDQAMANVMKQGASAVVFGTDDGPAGGAVDIFSLPRSGHWAPAVSVNQAASTMLRERLGADARLSLVPVDYTYVSGTSMAAPYVSGVAALLWSARPELTPQQVRDAMEASARDLGIPGRDFVFGHGLVRARNALQRLP
ncbi:S8 family serine peptidase [Corallococcus carmarthensis]|uniref:Peptidase S8 n=1 Tax=Corallococcus carmarthensis TaxID=2316728 RepID=A0A3A8KCM5_9BACT|nr:S8 family serine peptidase [Corallococcus carmarthensis]NOK22068.1 S8 family serine peptidase [Corallococcus carmarthensis]RKH05296.1 peptidase S8 [Corallococcus carmarthensis]